MASDIAADMAQSPYRTIWKLSWPQILMMVFHFFIGVADVWVAGKINREVQASLGLITQSLFFMLVVAVALANGAVAAISQSEGAGLHRRVQRYVGVCVVAALVLGQLFMFLCLPIRGLLLTALQVPQEMRYVTDYFLEVYLYVLPPYFLLVISNAVFRARKRVMFPLYSGIIITLSNAFLDLGLGLGWFGLPNIGYKGLAWATFGSITAGSLLNLAVLFARGDLSSKSLAPWRWIKKAAPYILKVAWPAGLMQIVWHSGYLVLYAITASLPVGKIDALAGMSIGLRIESFLFLPAFAFNMTASILIGHYLGARRPDEAKQFGLRILGIGLVFILIFAVSLWQIMLPCVELFTKDPAVTAQAMDYLWWNVLAIPFTLTSMILAGAFNGAGATLWNMLIMGGATWFLRLPLAYVLGHHVLKTSTGIWVAMLCSQIVQSATLFYCFKFRNWARFAMIKKKNNKDSQ
ncbi:MATE family efflux transporter [Salidesulfovibrio onnuriiensis]|uniref:MATE family efflux transporter n=1 Tax=Salidesulfovibrio onnuriiensis TaxID=2583823 RepID=UPI00202ACBCD|nr:MATE family efflux transporter [Salidesulfovibrio onnuriiensis]